MKKCRVCFKEQELHEFPISKGKIEARCKGCAREYARKYHYANRQKNNEIRKKYYQNNRENSLKVVKKYYQKNKEKIRKRCNERDKTPEYREKKRKQGMDWYYKNKERYINNKKKYMKANPEKIKARTYVMWALKLGVIKKPEECEKCLRKIKLEAHHTDYLKPLEVNWLCKVCHNHVHNKLLDVIVGEIK